MQLDFVAVPLPDEHQQMVRKSVSSPWQWSVMLDSCIQLEISQCNGMVFNNVSMFLDCYLPCRICTLKIRLQINHDLTASMVTNISMASSTILASWIRWILRHLDAASDGFWVTTAWNFLSPCPLSKHWSQWHRWLRLAECQPFKTSIRQLFAAGLDVLLPTIFQQLTVTHSTSIGHDKDWQSGYKVGPSSLNIEPSLKCWAKSFPCGLHPKLWTLFQCFPYPHIGRWDLPPASVSANSVPGMRSKCVARERHENMSSESSVSKYVAEELDGHKYMKRYEQLPTSSNIYINITRLWVRCSV